MWCWTTGYINKTWHLEDGTKIRSPWQSGFSLGHWASLPGTGRTHFHAAERSPDPGHAYVCPWLWRGGDLFLAKCVVSSVIWEIWVKDTVNTQNMSLQTHAGDAEDGVLRVLKQQGTSFKSCCSCSAAEECHHFWDAISVSLAEHNKQQQRRRQTETCEKQTFYALETSVILQSSFDN